MEKKKEEEYVNHWEEGSCNGCPPGCHKLSIYRKYRLQSISHCVETPKANSSCWLNLPAASSQIVLGYSNNWHRWLLYGRHCINALWGGLEHCHKTALGIGSVLHIRAILGWMGLMTMRYKDGESWLYECYDRTTCLYSSKTPKHISLGPAQ